MNKKRSVDLIHGPILPALLSFAFPILLSNIFQQLYNTADVLIVGRFLGQDSLAAVGATTAIFDLIIGFTLGVGNGMGIVIARYYGARNFTKIKEAVAATWILGGLLSILVMLMGFVGLYPLLQYLDTPAEILPQSYQYISMIVTCVGVSFAYNLFAGLLRSIGDSLAALGFLIFLLWLMWFWICILLRNCIWEFNLQALLPLSRKAYQRFFAFSISVRVFQNCFLNSSILNGTRPCMRISWSKVWLWV